MKKSLLAGAGVIGACAACCAIPIMLPLLSGLSAVGLAALNFAVPEVGGVPLLPVLAGIGAIAAMLTWRVARERKQGCAAAADGSCGPRDEPGAGGCGCGEPGAPGSAMR